jgi:putative flippase GtrA
MILWTVMVIPTLNKVRLFFLMRYLFAGGLAFTTNLMLLFIFTNYFHLWYLTSSTLSFIISVIVSFTVQKLITFRDRTTDRVHHQIAMYIAIALFNVTANGGIMFSLVDKAHVHYMLAQIFSAGIIAVWSLGVYRYIIFKHASIS